MWSFQMTPSNYQYVIFMWAKCIHRETAGQPRNQRLPYKLVDDLKQVVLANYDESKPSLVVTV